ncbi:UvrD-helicase domain-containing protein [Leptospira levettii]|uniref:UvrD-helicase domain-containing protein n=1 Tax=Leptospira levettii TaxID=2023178 RepID=UPI003EBFDC51
MQFYIADTFTDSLKRLSNPEQKQAKTTIFDLQTNPSHPGLKFHRLEKVKDPNFWSIRINDDIRCIIHKKENTILVCYVDHHDKAYSWAERRRIEVHPRTGSVQIVAIPESIGFSYSEKNAIKEENPKLSQKKALFSSISEEDILSLGVPTDWIPKIKEANEDSIFDYLEVLPAEAGEALLDLAYGKKKDSNKSEVETIPKSEDPFQHPDSLRRFKLVTSEKDLEEALQATWSKWTVYLHPSQKKLVEKEYSGPVRISGSAGTGKTVVAIHRAYHLLKTNEDNRILLTSFSDILVANLRQSFLRLASNEPMLGERIEFQTVESYAKRLAKRLFPNLKILSHDDISSQLEEHWKKHPLSELPKNLVFGEIHQVLLAWNLNEWNEYKTFVRMGRRSKLTENQRLAIWNFYNPIRENWRIESLSPFEILYFDLARLLEKETHSIFNAVILDEAQDLTPSQLRFLSSLTKSKENLFFTGDLGQRIFQIPFSWKSLGVEIKGRSFTLKINYRTSEEIRKTADKLLDREISDYDGIKETRDQTFSMFRGPKPEIVLYDDENQEEENNREWLQSLQSASISFGEILILVRSENEMTRAISILKSSELPFSELTKDGYNSQKITLTTMHFAKGLEFRAVLLLACDSDIIPNGERLAKAADEAELEEIYETERHLLYVACTRARDYLRLTGIKPGSEYLSDLK